MPAAESLVSLASASQFAVPLYFSSRAHPVQWLSLELHPCMHIPAVKPQAANANPSGLPLHIARWHSAPVRVTNRRNGRSITVRINDQDPCVRGRVIDITPAGASALGFSGLAPVNLELAQK